MIRLTARGLWAHGRCLPVEIGRGGLARDKCEGDGATPVGRHRIVGMLYRADRLAAPQPWAEPIGPQDLWCDAPDHPAYNLPVKAPFPPSHEALRRPDPLYDIVLVTDWNYPQAAPGQGSAIFVHQRRRAGYPTAGCLALRRDHLIWLAGRIARGEELLIPDLACFAQRRPGAAPRDKA